jgi:D-alanine--poly(phosphoribitol) ligase subunit 2
MDELLEILEDIKEDVDFEHETALVDDKLIDSLDVLQIIAALNEEFDIQVPASEILPKNFNSAQAIYDMVQRLQDE